VDSFFHQDHTLFLDTIYNLIQLQYYAACSGGVNSYFMRRPPHAKVGWVGGAG